MEHDWEKWLTNEGPRLFRIFEVREGQTVLDFGCRHGHYAIPAAHYVGNSGKVYAVDKEEEVLQSARRSAEAHHVPPVITYVNTHGETHLPIGDKSVDRVFLHDVLHLIGWEENAEGETVRKSTRAERAVLLQEVSRVLKPGGKISVYAPHLDTHTDIHSFESLRQEFARAGLYLEKEFYFPIIHDEHYTKGHLYFFTNRKPVIPEDKLIRINSPAFQDMIAGDPHVNGEITILKIAAEPGMNIIEAGANRGITTLILSERAGDTGRVYAFEPVPEYFHILTANLEQNGIRNVEPHQAAVTDQESLIPFYVHGEGSGIVTDPETTGQIETGTVSLDYFMEENSNVPIKLLNMDCEGAELLVLQGARKLLERDRPRIFCEIHHDYLARIHQSVQDIVQYLESLSFKVLPVSVEHLGQDVTMEECSHIFSYPVEEPLSILSGIINS